MVLKTGSDGPIYIGNIDPRHRYPDLSHPSQLQVYHFDVFMGQSTAGTGQKKQDDLKIANTDSLSTVLFFSRRSYLLDFYDKKRQKEYEESFQAEQTRKSLTKLQDVDMFSYDLHEQVLKTTHELEKVK